MIRAEGLGSRMTDRLTRRANRKGLVLYSWDLSDSVNGRTTWTWLSRLTHMVPKVPDLPGTRDPLPVDVDRAVDDPVAAHSCRRSRWVALILAGEDPGNRLADRRGPGPHPRTGTAVLLVLLVLAPSRHSLHPTTVWRA
jgi:hypothetical protein